MDTAYILLTVIVAIVSILILIFISCYNKLKGFKEKMDTADNIIDECLTEKLDVIINLNNIIKKETGLKDYLKDYIAIKDTIITNIEKDYKLDEAEKLVNNLIQDYKELRENEKFLAKYRTIRNIDEKLVAAKNLFNQNAVLSNKTIRSFPYSLVSKVSGFKYKTFYNNKELEDTSI